MKEAVWEAVREAFVWWFCLVEWAPLTHESRLLEERFGLGDFLEKGKVDGFLLVANMTSVTNGKEWARVTKWRGWGSVTHWKEWESVTTGKEWGSVTHLKEWESQSVTTGKEWGSVTNGERMRV